VPKRDQNHAPVKPRRSVLYLPGSNPRTHRKVRALPVDALILDLEDAVGPGDKPEARKTVQAALTEGGFGARETVVRINGMDTPWGAEDLAAMASSGVDAILVPKIRRGADLVDVQARLDGLAEGHSSAGLPDLWAMIETPQSIVHAEEIAALAARPDLPLKVFVMGTNDLALETGAALVPGRQALVPWLQTALVAARCHGVAVIDGVYNAIGDSDGYAAECVQGRELGMDGKSIIHPDQIEVANSSFSPRPDEVEAAQAILAAFARPEHRGKGVIQLDGRMVELLHAQMAARTVAIADAIAARDAG